MSIVRLVSDVVGGSSKSDVRIANLSESVNMFPETQGEGSSASTMLRSVYGTKELCRPSTRACRGLLDSSLTGDLYAVYGPSIYLIRFTEQGTYSYTTLYSSLTNVDTPVSIVETGGTNPYICIADGQNIVAIEANHLEPVDIIASIRTIALPYRVNSTTERINPTHLVYCYNYLLCTDSGSDAFYTSYQYPFERTYTNDSGAQSYVDSINTGIAKVAETTYTVEQDDTEEDIDTKINQVKVDDTLTASEKQQIVSLLEDYKSYELWKLSPPGITGDTDYDIFMINPWRVSEVGYKDWGFVTYSEWSTDNTTALASSGSLLYTFGPKSTQLFTYNQSTTNPWVSPTNTANGIGLMAVNSVATLADYVFFLGASNVGDCGVYYWNKQTITKISTPDIERRIATITNTTDAIGQCWVSAGHLQYALTFKDGNLTLVYDILEGKWHRRASKAEYTNVQNYWRLTNARTWNRDLVFGTIDGRLVAEDKTKFTEYDGRPIVRIRRSGMLLDNGQNFYLDGIKLICNSGDFRNPNLEPKVMLRTCNCGGEWDNQEQGLLGKIGQYDYEVEWFNRGIFSLCTLELSCSEDCFFSILNAKISHTICDWF